MCRCCDDSGFGLLDVSKKIFDGVLIKTSPMFLNRVTDWLGMRRQEKSGHVDQIRSQVEAGTELLPAHRSWFQLSRSKRVSFAERAFQSGRSNQMPSAHQEILECANSTARLLFEWFSIGNGLRMEHGRPRPSIVSGTPRHKRANANARFGD